MSDVAASTLADRRSRSAGPSWWQRLLARRPRRSRPLRVVSVLLGAEELVVVEGVLADTTAIRVQEALHAAADRSHVVVDLRRVRSLQRGAAEAVIAASSSLDHPAIVLAPARRRARHRLERAAAAAQVQLRHEPVADW
jgi:hypothetical protein